MVPHILLHSLGFESSNEESDTINEESINEESAVTTGGSSDAETAVDNDQYLYASDVTDDETSIYY